MNIAKLGKNDFDLQKWSGGKTEQIFILPEDSSYQDRTFKARLSSATVDKVRSEFTNLPEIHRFISPLNDELHLFTDRKEIAHLSPYDIFEFEGATPIISEGKCKDLNLMLNGKTEGEMKIWNTEKVKIKKIALPKHAIFWLFSYNAKGTLEINDQKIEINKMECIKIEEAKKYIELKTNINSKLFYGFIKTV